MRVATVMGVLLLGGAASLSAQHAHQFEIGGFASYTRFDRAFLLDNQIGGGGRLGFWITDWLGIEGDGLYMRPKPVGGGSGTNFPVWFASGSLVLNFGSERSFYLLGGYSAMDFNSSGVGGFRDAGAHAPRTSGAAATGSTNGTGAARVVSWCSGPTMTATPLSPHSAAIG